MCIRMYKRVSSNFHGNFMIFPYISIYFHIYPCPLPEISQFSARALEDAGTWRSWDQDVHHLWPSSFAPLGSATRIEMGELIPKISCFNMFYMISHCSWLYHDYHVPGIHGFWYIMISDFWLFTGRWFWCQRSITKHCWEITVSTGRSMLQGRVSIGILAMKHECWSRRWSSFNLEVLICNVYVYLSILDLISKKGAYGLRFDLKNCLALPKVACQRVSWRIGPWRLGLSRYWILKAKLLEILWVQRREQHVIHFLYDFPEILYHPVPLLVPIHLQKLQTYSLNLFDICSSFSGLAPVTSSIIFIYMIDQCISYRPINLLFACLDDFDLVAFRQSWTRDEAEKWTAALYCLMNQGSSDMCGSVYTHSNGTSHRPRYVEATELLLGIECSTAHLWDSVSGSYALQLGCREKTRATCQRYSSNREHWDGTVACCQVFVVCGFNILEMSAHVVRTGQYRTLLSLSCILSSQHPLNILNTRHHQTSCVLLQFTFGRWQLRATGGYYGYGSFISEDIVESMSRSPSSWEEAMSQPIADWTGVQRLWIRVFMSILILVNITLSNLANIG